MASSFERSKKSSSRKDYRCRKKSGRDDGGIELSVPELRRLLHMLGEPEEQRAKHVWWSCFRRRHQAGAKRAHMAWRAVQRPAVALPPAFTQQAVELSPLSDAQWGAATTARGSATHAGTL